MKKIYLLIFFIFVFIGCQKKQSKSLDSSLQEYFDTTSIPAAIMGNIDADGHMTWHHFGPSIWNDSTSVATKDHIFRIYSMSKAITTVAALQLVEKGLIGLDDSLNELMPEMVSIPILKEDGSLVQSDAVITLRQLLNNTSGFGSVFFSSRIYNFNLENWDYKDKPRLFLPGTSFAYGTGVNWAGKVIEKISGKNLETYFRENITGPLKMNHTWFNVPENLKEKIVTLGGRDSLGTINAWIRIPEIPETDFKGGSGLFGSPSDYLKFLNCLLHYGKYEGGQILKKESVQLMLENSLPVGMKLQFEEFDNGGIIGFTGGQFKKMINDTWGLGWFIELDEHENRPVNSVYWTGAANSYYTLDVEHKVAIIYFSNYFPANDKEGYDFYRLYEKEIYANLNINND